MYGGQVKPLWVLSILFGTLHSLTKLDVQPLTFKQEIWTDISYVIKISRE